MHKLASWFLGVFTTLAGFFMKFLSRRFAIVAAVVSVLVAMTVALSVALKASITGLVFALNVPPEFIAGFAALAPDNLEACIGAMLSTRLVIWAYQFNRDLLGMYLGGI